VGVGPPHPIRKPNKGGGHGALPNAHRDHRPQRLASEDLGSRYYRAVPLRMACVDRAPCPTTLSETRKTRPNPEIRH
jgi:hypothetical protein